MDITLRYPRELFELLVDTIPLLCRSEKKVLLFFQGAGVGYQFLSDLWLRVEQRDDDIQKHEIVRTTLSRLNEKEKTTLRQRKEILKKIKEFDDFSTCLPNDLLKAKERVSVIRGDSAITDTSVQKDSEVANSSVQRDTEVTDTSVQRDSEATNSLPKMQQELETTRKIFHKEHNARIETIKKKQIELDKIKDALFQLFGMADQQSQERDRLLEGVLNRLFTTSDVPVKEAFELVSDEGEVIKKQIEGLVEIEGYLYSVEMRWWQEPLGVAEISPHLINIFSRIHAAGGILISSSGFTESAIRICKEALSKKIIVLCELKEIAFLLENKGFLIELLKSKITAAVLEKKPLLKPQGYANLVTDQYSAPHNLSNKIQEIGRLQDKRETSAKHEKADEVSRIIDKKDTIITLPSNRPRSKSKTIHLDPPKEEQVFSTKEEILDQYVAGHDRIIENQDTATSTPSNSPPFTSKTLHLDHPNEEQMFGAKEEILNYSMVEHGAIADNSYTSITPSSKQSLSTSRRAYQKSSNEKQMFGVKEEFLDRDDVEHDDVEHNKKIKIENAGITKSNNHLPSTSKKASQGRSKEEQMLVGKEEILDRYVTELKKKSQGRGVIKLRRLLDLQRAYPDKPFIAAVKQAHKYGLYDLSRLEKIILDNIAGGNFFDLS